MARFKFTTTKSGKCDVNITLFSKDKTWLFRRSSTFDVKPTIKELKEIYKKRGGGRHFHSVSPLFLT